MVDCLHKTRITTCQTLFPKRMMAASILLFAVFLMLPGMAHAISNPLLSSQQTSSGDLSAFTKWTSLMPRYNREKAEADKQCKDDDCDARRWERMLSEQSGNSLEAKLDAVNDFFNDIKYVEDKDNLGVEDYWQTPYEFMSRGGDCEDYAIAKFISLKRLGVPESSMRIIIVQDNNLGGIMHAVLEVKSGGERYLLDNQASSVTNEANIYHYRPIYAINSRSWWAYR